MQGAAGVFRQPIISGGLGRAEALTGLPGIAYTEPMESVFQSRAVSGARSGRRWHQSREPRCWRSSNAIAFLILLAAVLTTLLVPVFRFHRFCSDGRLARDGGLSCHMLVFGLVLAAGTAGRSVAAEIASGTAAAVIGKPVSRSVFVLSKWLGVFLVVTIFWAGVLAATLAAERSSAHFLTTESFTGYATDPVTLTLSLLGVAVALGAAAVRHYVWRRRFGVAAFLGLTLMQVAVVGLSGFYNRFGVLFPLHGESSCQGGVFGRGARAHAAGGWLSYHVELNLRVVAAAVLVLLALAIFAALATALATRLPTGAALAVCVLVLLAGLAGDSFALDAQADRPPSWRVQVTY